ncbi:hypothetical protein T09_11216 [Trichinella sp. T9]|nr:hypothetical protein T09_11216 [Trichinella sp. T9]
MLYRWPTWNCLPVVIVVSLAAALMHTVNVVDAISAVEIPPSCTLKSWIDFNFLGQCPIDADEEWTTHVRDDSNFIYDCGGGGSDNNNWTSANAMVRILRPEDFHQLLDQMKKYRNKKDKPCDGQLPYNYVYGIVATPTVVLIYNGEQVARLEPHVDPLNLTQVIRFVEKHTNLRAHHLPAWEKLSSGPLKATMEKPFDWYLVVSWIFIAASIVYYGLQLACVRQFFNIVHVLWIQMQEQEEYEDNGDEEEEEDCEEYECGDGDDEDSDESDDDYYDQQEEKEADDQEQKKSEKNETLQNTT